MPPFGKSVGGLSLTAPSPCELQLTRTFLAPRSLVFDCWTKPDLVRTWLTGPDGWSMQTCTIDLTPGGTYRYEWRNRDGYVIGLSGTFTDVVAPERLVSEEVFDEDWTGGPARNTIMFTEADGVTTYTQTIIYASEAARDAAVATGMADGMEAGFTQLDSLLANGNP